MAQAQRNRSSYSYGYGYDRGYTYGSNGSAAYKRAAAPRRQAEPQRQPRRPMRVIPGSGGSTQRNKPLSILAIRSFKALVALAIVFAAVCGLRVWLSVSTVQAMQSTQTIQSQIEEARAAGNDLEIKHSALANPTRIKKEAAALGMSSPKNTERIKVSLKAQTKTFANGSISINSTVKSIENSLAAKKK